MSGERVSLINGVEHADKIGKVVIVDIEGVVVRGRRGGSTVAAHRGSVIVSGVLHAIEDLFGEGGDLERMNLTVGDTFLSINWSEAQEVNIELVGGGA